MRPITPLKTTLLPSQAVIKTYKPVLKNTGVISDPSRQGDGFSKLVTNDTTGTAYSYLWRGLASPTDGSLIARGVTWTFMGEALNKEASDTLIKGVEVYTSPGPQQDPLAYLQEKEASLTSLVAHRVHPPKNKVSPVEVILKGNSNLLHFTRQEKLPVVYTGSATLTKKTIELGKDDLLLALPNQVLANVGMSTIIEVVKKTNTTPEQISQTLINMAVEKAGYLLEAQQLLSMNPVSRFFKKLWATLRGKSQSWPGDVIKLKTEEGQKISTVRLKKAPTLYIAADGATYNQAQQKLLTIQIGAFGAEAYLHDITEQPIEPQPAADLTYDPFDLTPPPALLNKSASVPEIPVTQAKSPLPVAAPEEILVKPVDHNEVTKRVAIGADSRTQAVRITAPKIPAGVFGTDWRDAKSPFVVHSDTAQAQQPEARAKLVENFYLSKSTQDALRDAYKKLPAALRGIAPKFGNTISDLETAMIIIELFKRFPDTAKSHFTVKLKDDLNRFLATVDLTPQEATFLDFAYASLSQEERQKGYDFSSLNRFNLKIVRKLLEQPGNIRDLTEALQNKLANFSGEDTIILSEAESRLLDFAYTQIFYKEITGKPDFSQIDSQNILLVENLIQVPVHSRAFEDSIKDKIERDTYLTLASMGDPLAP